VRTSIICKAAVLANLWLHLAANAQVAQVDQYAPPGNNGGINSQLTDIAWQQEVVTGTSGFLTSIDLFAGEFPGSFRFFVNTGTGWQTDADAFSVVVSPQPLQEFSVNVSPLYLSKGDTFVVGVQGLGPSTECCGLRVSHSPSWSGGRLYLNGTLQFNGDMVIALRTYVLAVPESSTWSMSLGGLVLLAGLARSRKSPIGNRCS